MLDHNDRSRAVDIIGGETNAAVVDSVLPRPTVHVIVAAFCVGLYSENSSRAVNKLQVMSVYIC